MYVVLVPFVRRSLVHSFTFFSRAIARYFIRLQRREYTRVLSETRGDGGRERAAGAGPGGAEAEATGLQEIRGQRNEGQLEHDRAARGGAAARAAARGRSAATAEGAEHPGSPADGKVSQSGAADSSATLAR